MDHYTELHDAFLPHWTSTRDAYRSALNEYRQMVLNNSPVSASSRALKARLDALWPPFCEANRTMRFIVAASGRGNSTICDLLNAEPKS